jgi:large subunit ribosomal protein L4
MMQVAVRSLAGQSVGNVELDERVFGIEPNRAVLHQAVVAQLANQRQGTAETKTRAMVSGGGKKPWRQKGTGRARQGSTRAPHWRGGGIVFGPHLRDYHQRLPRKMRRLALRSALSDKLASGQLVIVDRLTIDDGRTKSLIAALGALGLAGRVVMVVPEADGGVRRSSNNLPNVHVALPGGLALLDLMHADHVVLSQEAIAPITAMLVGDERRQAASATVDGGQADAASATVDDDRAHAASA